MQVNDVTKICDWHGRWMDFFLTENMARQNPVAMKTL